MPKRDQVRLNIQPETNAVLDRLCDRYGMSKVEMATRVYRWFAQQDEIVQTSVLGLLPDAVEEHAADIYMEQVKAKRSAKVKSTPARSPKGK